MSNKQTELMGNAPVSKAILKLSIPVVCGMMVQVLYNLVDTFFIGRLHDQNQLAAASITTPVFMILMAISTIVSTGAASYISRCIGQKDTQRASKTLTTGMIICALLAVLAMSVGLIFIKPFIMALGASAKVYPFAHQYVTVMLIGAIPVMLSFAGGQLLRAEGAAMPSIIGILNNQAKAYGDTVLAGMGVSSKLAFIGTFIFMGFAAGCQPLIGYNFGAGNYRRVREIFKTGMTMTCCIGIILTAIFWFFADGLIAVFTPLPEVIEQGAHVFRISIFAFVILGPQMLATTGIQAFGKAKESLILSVARQGFVYIPLLFLLQSWMGFNGLIWAQPIADAITLCIGLAFLKVILKKCNLQVSPDHSDLEDTVRQSD